MKRQQAINVIVADVAQNGCATKSAIRAYVENRVSRAAFDEACKLGMRIFENNRSRIESVPPPPKGNA